MSAENWAEALVDAISGPEIPFHAESLERIRERLCARGREWSTRGVLLRMRALVKAGMYVEAKGMRPKDHCPKMYYWPKQPDGGGNKSKPKR